MAKVESQHTVAAFRVTKGISLVFPAASRPSMRILISLDPKILAITLETWPPIVTALRDSLTTVRGFRKDCDCRQERCSGGSVIRTGPIEGGDRSSGPREGVEVDWERKGRLENGRPWVRSPC